VKQSYDMEQRLKLEKPACKEIYCICAQHEYIM